MGVDVVALGQLALDALAQQALHQRGPALAELVAALGGEGLEPLDGGPRPARRQQALKQPVGDGVLGRQRGDVGGRPLEHRHVGGGVGHRRDQRDRGGAAADHHHALARVVEVFGPRLRVHDGALEPVHAGEVGLVAVVVAVVAAAREHEAAGELDGLAGVGALGGDVPAGLLGGPVGPHDAVVEPDVLVDAGLGGGVLDVLQDRLAVGDRLLAVPRTERVAEREHVGVGADAGVAEQVPRAADGVAGLEDGVAGPRALGLHVVAGADAGQAGADDEDVEVLHVLFGPLRR